MNHQLLHVHTNYPNYGRTNMARIVLWHIRLLSCDGKLDHVKDIYIHNIHDMENIQLISNIYPKVHGTNWA